MSISAASLTLPSLAHAHPSQSLFNSKQCVFSLSPKPNSITISISISSAFLHSHRRRASPTLSSRFSPNVALSSEFDQQEDTFSDADQPNFSPDLKLFVGNLPFSVDSAQLAQLFETVGTVEMVEVIYDKGTGRSRGFGFVTMSSPQEVEAAEQQFNGYELEGRALRVNSGPPPPRKEGSPFRGGARGGPFSNSANRVHVSNLAWGVDQTALESLFGEQGKVLEAKVIYDRESGRSRGFGYVTYGSAEEVNSAIESLDGVDLSGRPIRVSLAEPKPRREF